MIHPLAPPAVIDSVASTDSRFLAFPNCSSATLSQLEEKRNEIPLDQIVIVPMAGSGDLVSRVGLWAVKRKSLNKCRGTNTGSCGNMIGKDRYVIPASTATHIAFRLPAQRRNDGRSEDYRAFDHNFNVLPTRSYGPLERKPAQPRLQDIP